MVGAFVFYSSESGLEIDVGPCEHSNEPSPSENRGVP
jgi:hypothetical protein